MKLLLFTPEQECNYPFILQKNPPYRDHFFSDTSIIKQIGMSICVCIMGDLFIKKWKNISFQFLFSFWLILIKFSAKHGLSWIEPKADEYVAVQ